MVKAQQDENNVRIYMAAPISTAGREHYTFFGKVVAVDVYSVCLKVEDPLPFERKMLWFSKGLMVAIEIVR